MDVNYRFARRLAGFDTVHGKAYSTQVAGLTDFLSFGLPAVLYAMRKPSACDARCDFTVACRDGLSSRRTRRERGRKPTLTTR